VCGQDETHSRVCSQEHFHFLDSEYQIPYQETGIFLPMPARLCSELSSSCSILASHCHAPLLRFVETQWEAGGLLSSFPNLLRGFLCTTSPSRFSQCLGEMKSSIHHFRISCQILKASIISEDNLCSYNWLLHWTGYWRSDSYVVSFVL
jgi:hypothetical protein